MKKLNIVLVGPDFSDFSRQYPLQTMRKIPPQIPLGLCYLAAVLEENDFQVSIIDNYVHGFSSGKLVREISNCRPAIVGFTVSTQTSFQAFETARLLKKEMPEVKVVFGGIHPSVLPEKVNGSDVVDFVIVSEGEYALLELVQALQKDPASIPAIKGLFYKNEFGKSVYNGYRPPIPDLDQLPFPARHLINLDHYREDSGIYGVTRLMSINSSRGCPFRCAFCSSSQYWDKCFRARSPKNIVDEIEMLVKTYGTDGIRFREDNFTTNKKRVIAICDELKKRKISIPWECESRVDTIDRNTLEIMKKGGCRAVWFGVESGNQKTLDILNKNVKLDRIRMVFSWCHELDITTGATFMLGIPGETRDDVLNTLEFAKEINPEWASFQAYLGLPTSPLYQKVCQENMCYHRIEDICIVQTPTLRFHEIARLEKYLNESYFRYKMSFKSGSSLFKLIIRKLPFSMVRRLTAWYLERSFSFRNKVKSIIKHSKA